MKSTMLLLLFVCSFWGLSAQKQLPKVNVENLKGETISIQQILADSVPVVLSFWSTTCKPCIQELDAMAEQYDDWQKDFKFKVIAISVDDSRAASKVKALAGGRGWPFEVLLDKNQDLKRAMNVNSIPQLFILNKKGRVVFAHSGYTPGSEAEVYDVLKEMK